MPRECGVACFVSSKDVKVNSPTGYAICSRLQPLLADAPHYPEHCGGNATESWRNRHIAFSREQQKTRPRGRGLVLSRRRKTGIGPINIWRRPAREQTE